MLCCGNNIIMMCGEELPADR